MTERTVRIGNPVNGRIPPNAEDARIIGQIRRGEVIAGPEGARRIAARQEAAYGEVWDRAWTAAVTDATEAGDDRG